MILRNLFYRVRLKEFHKRTVSKILIGSIHFQWIFNQAQGNKIHILASFLLNGYKTVKKCALQI